MARATTGKRRGAAAFAGLLVVFLLLGLCLVWLNIERVDLAYRIRKLEAAIETRRELVSKLEVELNNLRSPARLRGLAATYGLAPAEPGQIRRMGGDG